MTFRRTGLILENSLGEVIADVYEFDVKPLGEGSYGTVTRGMHKRTGAERAIKIVSKSRLRHLARFRLEIEIMKEMEHPNIIRLYETYEDDTNIYLVMELCTGGELFDRIISVGTFCEREAAAYVKQMLSALFYMHNHGICHRDIKPENFLLSTGDKDAQLKMIDFGLSSRFSGGEFMRTKSGTPYYVAPEVLGGLYTEKCDIWSVGVLAFIMLCGYPPFNGRTDKEILALVKRGCVKFMEPEWSAISVDAKDFVKRLLEFNPNTRFSAREALEHVWLKNNVIETASVVDPDIQSRILSSLRQFRTVSKLKKIALTAIAHQLNDSELEGLKELFQSMDVNGDGTLTIDEIKLGLTRKNILLPPDFEIFFNDIDLDGNGTIDYMDRRLYQQRDVCWRAFKIFDRDNSGKISIAEFLKVIQDDDSLDEEFNSSNLRLMVKEFDLNNDGEIDFDEFVAMIGGGGV
jgi:calcium-dependent protein kinase